MSPPSSAMAPPPPGSSPIAGSHLQSPSSPHRRLSTGAIVGIAFGAFTAVLCAILVFFLFRRRRARRRAKRTSVGSSLRRLEPHPYSGTFESPSYHHTVLILLQFFLSPFAFRWLKPPSQFRMDVVRLRVCRPGLRIPAGTQPALSRLQVRRERRGDSTLGSSSLQSWPFSVSLSSSGRDSPSGARWTVRPPTPSSLGYPYFSIRSWRLVVPRPPQTRPRGLRRRESIELPRGQA